MYQSFSSGESSSRRGGGNEDTISHVEETHMPRAVATSHTSDLNRSGKRAILEAPNNTSHTSDLEVRNFFNNLKKMAYLMVFLQGIFGYNFKRIPRALFHVIICMVQFPMQILALLIL